MAFIEQQLKTGQLKKEQLKTEPVKTFLELINGN